MPNVKKPSRLAHIKDRVVSTEAEKANKDENSKSHTDEMGEILAKRYANISVYNVLMLVLAFAIVWTSVLIAMQVQQQHLAYRTYQDMKAQYQRLQIEHRRLLIEQQTFSATPQIASRAVTELGMFNPTTKDKWILQPTVPPASTGVATNPALNNNSVNQINNTNVNNTNVNNSNVATSYITTQEVTP